MKQNSPGHNATPQCHQHPRICISTQPSLVICLFPTSFTPFTYSALNYLLALGLCKYVSQVLLAADFLLNCTKKKSLAGDFKVEEGRTILILALKASAVALLAGDGTSRGDQMAVHLSSRPALPGCQPWQERLSLEVLVPLY